MYKLKTFYIIAPLSTRHAPAKHVCFLPLCPALKLVIAVSAYTKSIYTAQPSASRKPRARKPDHRTGKNTPKTPKAPHLAKVMRLIGTERLLKLRYLVWDNADKAAFGLYPQHLFLPDQLIKTILDNLATLTTSSIATIPKDNKLLANYYHASLLDILDDLRLQFGAIREVKKQQQSEQQKLKATAAEGLLVNLDPVAGVEDDSGDDSDCSSSNGSNEGEDEALLNTERSVAPVLSGIKWTLNYTVRIYILLLLEPCFLTLW